MENTRETKEVTIGAHTFTLHTYITGRESRLVQTEMINNLEMKQANGSPEISGFKGELIALQEDRLISAIVTVMDGSSENIIDRILDLPTDEYDAILKEVRTVAEGKKQASN